MSFTTPRLVPLGGGVAAGVNSWDLYQSCSTDIPAAGSGEFYDFGQAGGGAAESNKEMTVMKAMTITEFGLNLSANAKTADFTWALRKNGSVVSSFTIATTVTGLRTSGAISISFAIGDEFNFQYQPGTDTGNTVTINSFAATFER